MSLGLSFRDPFSGFDSDGRLANAFFAIKSSLRDDRSRVSRLVLLGGRRF